MESGELKAKKETALSMAEEGMDIQKIYRQLDVVESTDLEYNKYGVKRASDIQKKGSKIIENRNQQYYFCDRQGCTV